MKQETQNRLKNRLHVNLSAQESFLPQHVYHFRKSGPIPTQLNRSAQRRSEGSQTHLTTGPKISPEIKSSQSSALLQSSQQP